MMREIDKRPPYFQADSSIPGTPIILFDGKELNTWQVKALPHPVGIVNIFMGAVLTLPAGVILYEFFANQSAMENVLHTDVAIFAFFLWVFFWKKVVLQKNVYKIRFTEVGGQANYWPDIPENMGVIFKWMVGISAFVIICMMAVMPFSIFLLAGPGGMAILASSSLLKWKRKIHYSRFKWDQLNWIVIDRKRKLVVFTSHWDYSKTFEEQYVCFEAFVPTAQIEDLIKIAKSHAPTCTHFEQCHWDGCNE